MRRVLSSKATSDRLNSKTQGRTHVSARQPRNAGSFFKITILFDYEYCFAEYEYDNCILIFILYIQVNPNPSNRIEEHFYL